MHVMMQVYCSVMLEFVHIFVFCFFFRLVIVFCYGSLLFCCSSVGCVMEEGGGEGFKWCFLLGGAETVCEVVDNFYVFVCMCGGWITRGWGGREGGYLSAVASNEICLSM